MAFQRGNKLGGRKKGAKNKIPRGLVDTVLAVLKRAGGPGGAEAYLLRLARNDPKTFIPLVQKLLPTKISGDPESPLLGRGPVSVAVKFVDPPKGKTK